MTEHILPHPTGAAGDRVMLAYIALGSNIGDRVHLLQEALERLDGHPRIGVERVSGVYETDPVGFTDQPPFLNMAAELRTSLDPLELLHVMLDVENELGRTREIRWGPRTIDLDLLLADDIVMTQDELTLPHPRMMERAFVLVPLRDVLPAGHPFYEKVSEAADKAASVGEEGIMLWNTINWRTVSEHSGS
ncbi:2-amino-4-hydroxy-6-hydroxymethyldihydropteridine diphosphokinase [Paenibacillus humicola]|uniref:2-amino-4-hydroxy-6- hydroxymethyldihydropteridine diphosphokinase n=1 Tax=Paenibacillus humicola TaxID=3110540 RepID=UPI00237A0DAA|nr:2-amino-4-hydroxy-6-hydroxymethyldihydropteridine diphosphokinase [Paenibacillus humicola]